MSVKFFSLFLFKLSVQLLSFIYFFFNKAVFFKPIYKKKCKPNPQQSTEMRQKCIK